MTKSLYKFTSVLALFLIGALYSPSAHATESFEKASLGKATTLKTQYGTLTTTDNGMEIISGGRTGDKSLRISGGDTEVKLTLTNPPKQDIFFTAWAERWTSRAPFEFSVYAVGSFGEEKIYTGDKNIKLGGFNTKIEGKIPAGTKELLIKSSTPDGSGVKIDDLYIVPIIPMKIEALEATTNVYPVMIREEYNPVINLRIQAEGLLKPLSLNEVHLDLSGTTSLKDIKEISLYKGSTKVEDAPGEKWGSSRKIDKDGKVVIKSNKELEPGDNYFWVSVTLSDNANMSGKINTTILGVYVDKKPLKVANSPLSSQRIGYAVVKPGDYNSKFYRIPGIAQTKKGTLLAVYDIRYDHSGDLPANIDVGVSRSTDGGKTWSPVSMCIDDKTIAPKLGPTKGVGDPAIMIDEKTGRIWVAAIWSHKHSIWGSKSGDNSPDAAGQLVFAYSDNDGVTWSSPINVTNQTKRLEWKILFNGPGMGITMKNGTLVMPAQFWDENGVPYSTIVYSTNNGESWQTGNGCYDQTTEAQVVELKDGSLMLNCRCNKGGTRVVMITNDLGQTWEEHSTNRKDLPEPVCQGSIIAIENTAAFKRALFFSNPATNRGRSRNTMTIKASLDEGTTWPQDKQLLYDIRPCWGYSCLTPVDKNHIGVFYEGRGAIYFLRIPYKEILNKK